MGHIHGPAEPGENAPAVIPFAKMESPIEGSATLTDAQAADLKAGRLYINIHTAQNKGGEIRGQVTGVAGLFR
jgi:CHRD domain